MKTPTAAALSEVLAGLDPGHRISVLVKNQSGSKRTVMLTFGTYPGS